MDFEGEERPRRLRQLTVRALAEGLLSVAQAERVCPGVTRDIDDLASEPTGAMSARSLVRLPPAQRERLLEQAAAVIADEYEDEASLSGFEAMSWEDHVDASLDDD